MAVGGGTGNTISFSDLRAFYTDGNQNTGPISISDYNRGGDKVPSSVVGASTLTSSSGAGTKNDFGITQTTQTVYTEGEAGDLILRAEDTSTTNGQQVQVTYTVLASDAVITLVGGGLNNQSGDDPPEYGPGWNSTGVYNSGSIAGGQNRHLKGPAYQSGDHSNLSFHNSSPLNTGNLTVTSTSGSNSGFVRVRSARRTGSTLYDITFTNNNSTGDTYTLTSNSTRIGSNSQVYSAGTSRKVKDDSGSNAWQIAYDNVTGAGAGTAGDISVSAPYYTGSAAHTMQDSLAILRASQTLGTGNSGVSMSVSYTVHPSEAFFRVSGGGYDNIGQGETQLSSGWSASGAISRGPQAQALSFTGPANNNKLGFSGTLAASGTSGDVGTGTLTVTTTAGSAGGSLQIHTARRYGAINLQNNNSSKAYSLGSDTTGGAAELAASATRGVNTGTISTNPNWEVHFDTSSGSCNTNLPTTIGSGNSVNLDLFNAPGTAVGS